jgi:glycine/sarcosine N-methyltransferase
MNFYAAIAEQYDEVFPFDSGIASFLEREMKGRARLLDVACGSGTYAVRLATLGHEVLGVDSEEAMIEAARGKARPLHGMSAGPVHDFAAPGSGADFRVLDMAALDTLPSASFDGVYCIGNSLAHLGTKEDAAGTVAAMARRLAPGGRIVLQSINVPGVLAKGGALPAIESGAVRFERRYEKRGPGSVWFDTTLAVKAGNRILRNRIPLLDLGPGDLADFIAGTGLADLRSFGSYGGAAFDPAESFVVILTARAP